MVSLVVMSHQLPYSNRLIFLKLRVHFNLVKPRNCFSSLKILGLINSMYSLEGLSTTSCQNDLVWAG